MENKKYEWFIQVGMFLKLFMTAWTEVVAATTLVVLINSKGSQPSVRDQGRKREAQK